MYIGGYSQDYNTNMFFLLCCEFSSLPTGRATSNEDGVAIAWSIAEFLLIKRTMTFFVTHYPQLASMADIYPNVQNQHLGAVVDGEKGIRYMHKIYPGPCQFSSDYGVEMASTCGWQQNVVRMVRLFWCCLLAI